MMEREIGYYIIYAFLPSLMCVLLSWASFWIKLSVAPARVALGITTYLSIKTLAFTFQNGMPRNRSNIVIFSMRRTPKTTGAILNCTNVRHSDSVSFETYKRVSYVKAIDIWMLGCDTFVFVAFLEFTMAQYLLRKSTTQIVQNGVTKSKCIPSSDNGKLSITTA